MDLVDTLCAGLELAHIYHPGRLRGRLGSSPSWREELAAAPADSWTAAVPGHPRGGGRTAF